MPTSSKPKGASGSESHVSVPTDSDSFESSKISCVARLFSALGDPTRLTLLKVMHENGPMCVTDLAAAAHLSVSAVSHQLRLLRDRELITARREGRLVRYSILDDHVSMLLDIGTEHALEDCRANRGGQ